MWFEFGIICPLCIELNFTNCNELVVKMFNKELLYCADLNWLSELYFRHEIKQYIHNLINSCFIFTEIYDPQQAYECNLIPFDSLQKHTKADNTKPGYRLLHFYKK